MCCLLPLVNRRYLLGVGLVKQYNANAVHPTMPCRYLAS